MTTHYIVYDEPIVINKHTYSYRDEVVGKLSRTN